MHTLKVLIIALVLCIVPLSWTCFVRAAAGSTVVKIDGDAFSAEDVSSWWQYWQDEGMEVPTTPEPYIDWVLLVQEAERMALFDDPQYQHDANVYLKVLSLVRLKSEEIDSRIDYSEENLWAYYQEQFSPQWLLNILLFKDQEGAGKALAELRTGKVTVAELAKIAGERSKEDPATNPHGEEIIDVEELKRLAGDDEKLLGVHENLVKRPYSIDKRWREALAGLAKGDFSAPFPWQESYAVLHLLDSAPGDREDFAKQKNNVQNRYRKYRTAVLTNDLVARLMKKFAVRIDEERISGLDPSLSLDQFTDTPVITFSTMTVSEKQLMEKVLQDLEETRKYGFTPEEMGRVVKRVAGGVVSQTLITMESLARNYEEVSPTKELFAFYRRNKLVNRLEEQIRTQVKDVSEQDITAYYQEHLADFTSPHVYQMALIKGAEEELKKIWLEVVVNGNDVMRATEERLGQKPQVASYPANHLSPEVKEKADVLAKGDLSQVFPTGDGFAMVYMVEAYPSQTAKLENVREMIAKKLRRERFAVAREEYLKALREKVKIEINDKAWNKLREELVKKNENK